MVPITLRAGVPPKEGERRGGGEVDGRGRGGLSILPKEVEAHTVFPLKTGHDDAVRYKPGPPDAAVGGPDQSDSHSALHVPAGTGVRLLPFMRDSAGDAFKRCLCLNTKKATH